MPQAEKVVRYIAPKASVSEDVKNKYKQKRVAAYCRVSTQQEEQINSYEVQTRYYTEKINSEPKWKLVRIFADKGISGTSTKHRDEFNKMIRMCKRGRIDMIITKSISRFARNTVDCLKYIRMLKDINVDVFFEEQGIHSIENGSEFYITVYGSIAQSESENISANVKWGKEQSAREGNVSFHYKNFLGYRKGDDGKPEIVPEEAETIQYIYERFLAGDSHQTIISKLESNNILTPGGKEKWTYGTLHSILTNERYMGDAIINKTYTVDCISKKKKRNNGERAKYYVENNHPAIIDRIIFGKVQEEIARRSGLRKVKQVGTKTELGKYSSKYSLTELLICGECGTPYRRCTWTSCGNKRIVWRCISRLDYGKKRCHDSPTMGEGYLISDKDFSADLRDYPFYGNWRIQKFGNYFFYIYQTVNSFFQEVNGRVFFLIGHAYNPYMMEIDEEELHRAIMKAVQTVAMQNSKLLQTLKNHIAMTVKCNDSEDKELEIKVRLAEISEKFQKVMLMVSIDDDNNVIIEQKLTELIMEKELLNKELAKCSSDHKATSQSKINEIARLTDILENQPLQFNDELIRQMLQCIVVESKERIKVIFNDGTEIDQPIQ